MAGAAAMADVRTEKSVTAIGEKWQWQVKYSRCFTHPPSHLCDITISAPKILHFKPIWISSTGPSTLSLHPSADGVSSDSIITISLQGTPVEEHLISKLHFTWPQVSCLSGFPARGSLAVLASYIDTTNQKQKFAFRFSTISETEDFIASLEDIFSNKIPKELPAINVLSAISSQSVVVPAYRPDTTSLMTPTHCSPLPNYMGNEDCRDSQGQDRDSESNVSAFPPRFTSLVSNCSAKTRQDELALALPAGSKNLNLKAQIVKYMQDASFLDIVNKVNEVICELGEDFVL